MESSYPENDAFVIKRSDSADSSASVVDSMVTATKRCNTWVVDYCTMCTEYMDKQVQYEIMSARFQDLTRNNTVGTGSTSASTSTTFDLQGAVGACHQNFDDIAATAAMMFDEESVVESVDGR